MEDERIVQGMETGKSDAEASKSKDGGKDSRPNGRRGKGGGKGKEAGRSGYSDRYPYAKGSNDAGIYKGVNNDMMSSVSNIYFAWPVGKPIPAGLTVAPTDVSNTRRLPGLITLQLSPTVGRSDDERSALNTAAMSEYIFVRKNKAGNLPFDAPDLACLNLAIADVYSYINFLQRVYANTLDYTQENIYIPEALLQAQYVDAKNLAANLANFRYGINLLISQAASLAAPSTIDIYKRRSLVYQNYYTEGTSIKDQLYMYVPEGFLQLDDGTQNDTGTRLQFKRYAPETGTGAGSTLYTYDQLINFGLEMISAVRLSTDVQTMQAFIYAAYEPANLLNLQSLPEEYHLQPVFDIAVLEQMKNANVVPRQFYNQEFFTSLSIQQDSTKGYLLAQPHFEAEAPTGPASDAQEMLMENFSRNRFLTTTTEYTDGDLVIDSTRLMISGVYAPGTGTDGRDRVKLYCGSEIVSSCIIWTFSSDGSLTSTAYGDSEVVVTGGSSQGILSLNTEALLYLAMNMSSFKFHPCMDIFEWNEGTNTLKNWFNVHDLDNFTIMQSDEIQRIHEACILNQLNVPRMLTARSGSAKKVTGK